MPLMHSTEKQSRRYEERGEEGGGVGLKKSAQTTEGGIHTRRARCRHCVQEL